MAGSPRGHESRTASRPRSGNGPRHPPPCVRSRPSATRRMPARRRTRRRSPRSSRAKLACRLLGRGAPVIARHVGDQLDLPRREAAQVAVQDQVVGVLVMLLVIDQVADVVQQRGGPQDVARLEGQRERVAQRVEQLRRRGRRRARSGARWSGTGGRTGAPTRSSRVPTGARDGPRRQGDPRSWRAARRPGCHGRSTSTRSVPRCLVSRRRRPRPRR